VVNFLGSLENPAINQGIKFFFGVESSGADGAMNAPRAHQ
jgi:hypothetical protein